MRIQNISFRDNLTLFYWNYSIMDIFSPLIDLHLMRKVFFPDVHIKYLIFVFVVLHFFVAFLKKTKTLKISIGPFSWMRMTLVLETIKRVRVAINLHKREEKIIMIKKRNNINKIIMMLFILLILLEFLVSILRLLHPLSINELFFLIFKIILDFFIKFSWFLLPSLSSPLLLYLYLTFLFIPQTICRIKVEIGLSCKASMQKFAFEYIFH